MIQNVTVKMVRDNLENIPEFALPPEFSTRSYQSGDQQAWLKIQTAADHFNKITLALFQSEFAETDLLMARQFFILDKNREPIGTATAWRKDIDGQNWGRIHWVAVMPEYQRRGIGKAMLTSCCQRLHQFGHKKAYLSTSSARIPAIKLYLSFGFQPWVQSEAERKVWSEIEQRIRET